MKGGLGGAKKASKSIKDIENKVESQHAAYKEAEQREQMDRETAMWVTVSNGAYCYDYEITSVTTSPVKLHMLSKN